MRRKKPINLEHLKTIEPITPNQERVFKSYGEGKNLCLHGAAGTGKTFISLYMALKQVLEPDNNYEKVYMVRSLVPTREIGFLPGFSGFGFHNLGEILPCVCSNPLNFFLYLS